MRWGKRKGFPPSHSLCSCWSALNIEVDYDDEDDDDDDDDDDNKNEVAKKCNINFCKILRIRNVQQQQCRSIWTYIYYCCSCCSSWGYLCPQGDAQTLSPLLYAPPPFHRFAPPMSHYVFSSGVRGESLWDGGYFATDSGTDWYKTKANAASKRDNRERK